MFAMLRWSFAAAARSSSLVVSGTLSVTLTEGSFVMFAPVIVCSAMPTHCVRCACGLQENSAGQPPLQRLDESWLPRAAGNACGGVARLPRVARLSL